MKHMVVMADFDRPRELELASGMGRGHAKHLLAVVDVQAGRVVFKVKADGVDTLSTNSLLTAITAYNGERP